jgi:hypothetical protein
MIIWMNLLAAESLIPPWSLVHRGIDDDLDQIAIVVALFSVDMTWHSLLNHRTRSRKSSDGYKNMTPFDTYDTTNSCVL